MEKTASPWSVIVTVEDIPDTGAQIAIEAPSAARMALAKVASLLELPQLSASFELTRAGAGVHVVGQVKARVGQTCVVTLEPMESEVAEAVDVRFLPLPEGAMAEPQTRKKPRAGEESPEPLIDGQINLAALAVEFLMLGIDPYPRKAGAQFVPPKVEDAGEHPFAALAALKKRQGGGQP
jgi:hypothetical protein